MKEVIGNLERILELTCGHGVRTKSGEVAENENQLGYTESKIRFNAIQALNAFDRAHIEKEKTKRVKHEKVKFNQAWEAVKAFEDGKKLYTKRSHKDFVLVDSAQDVLRFLYELYTETPIEWWEDALQFAKDNADNKITVCESRIFDGGELFINASMNHDKWCDFARILLEQGE